MEIYLQFVTCIGSIYTTEMINRTQVIFCPVITLQFHIDFANYEVVKP